MPIYAYKCASCGYAQDVLQKISDPLLTVCPQCGEPAFQKQVTAAGFQLKGTGWYVTDFRGGASAAPDSSADKAGKGQAQPDQANKGGETGTAAKPETKSGAEAKAQSKNQTTGGGDAPAAPTPAKPAPSAPGGGSGD